MRTKLSIQHLSPARGFIRWYDSENKEFKDLFEELYREFPRIRYSENKIKEALPAGTEINALVKHGFLIDEPHDSGIFYGLGPNGLLLINAWEMEKLTRRMFLLTVFIAIITAISMFFYLIYTPNLFKP